MFYNYKNYFLFSIVILIFTTIGCKKDEAKYPDCFENESTFIGGRQVESCGAIFGYIIIDDTNYLTISIDEQNLDITSECNAFSLADVPNQIQIELHTIINRPDSLLPDSSFPFFAAPYVNFCTDIEFPEENVLETTKWPAVSGIVVVAVSKEKSKRDQKGRGCERFDASIKLENVRLIKQNSNEEITIGKIVLKDLSVGF